MPTRHLLALSAALAMVPGAARAHHSFAAFFDPDKSVSITGTVTEFRFTNPHGMIALDVKKPDGSSESWAFEAGTPSVLFRRGVTKESVKVGMEVTVDGYQAKDGSHRANGRNLTLPNGQTLFLGSSGTGAPEERR